MTNPEAPQDDTTQVEQPVQTDATQTDTFQATEQTEQLDTGDDATRAIEVDDAERPAEPVAHWASDRPAAEPAEAPAAADEAVWPPTVPERPSGPHAPAIVLGLVCLAVAAIVLAQEVGSLNVDWGDVGPLGIVATGALLVLFGLAGLLSSRRKTR